MIDEYKKFVTRSNMMIVGLSFLSLILIMANIPSATGIVPTSNSLAPTITAQKFDTVKIEADRTAKELADKTKAVEAKRIADEVEVKRLANIETQRAAAVAETARQALIVEANRIAQEEANAAAVATQTRSSCHPSYDPCIPNGPDLDCPEVRALVGSVRVIGVDSYRLDRDKDGIGCE
jgi:hypothetical protein